MPGLICAQQMLIEDGENPSPEAESCPKAQILIAEDDDLIVCDMKSRLESLNYEVTATTPRAKEALALARSLKPDIVLMDIQLPGEMDGIAAAEGIRRLQIPFIYVTGYCDGPLLERAKRTEPYGYILKPYETRDFKTAIEVGLHKHRVESEREKLLKRLQDSLSKVNSLAGLLSICAYCKRIKEDAGYWREIEMYIAERSQASFTHGMCPDCFQRVKKQLDELGETGSKRDSMVIG
jgi:CheY-like chemotaxis protein